MKDERKFEDVVRTVARSEADVDKLLAAARLERHESNRHMTGEQKFYLLLALIGMLAVLGFFGMFVIPDLAVRLAKLK